MNKTDFIQRNRFLYHLTDRRNLLFIDAEKRLWSTRALVEKAMMENPDKFLRARRPEHTTVKVDGYEVFIRDQRPLNKALAACLTDGWTPEQFIYLLNGRVFTWPNIPRLEIHYGRYAQEKPVILRLDTAEVLDLNPNAEFSRINSGATRPSGALDGKAAARGKDTFLPMDRYESPPRSVAEVTFSSFCILPDEIQTGNSPQGPWRSLLL